MKAEEGILSELDRSSRADTVFVTEPGKPHG